MSTLAKLTLCALAYAALCVFVSLVQGCGGQVDEDLPACPPARCVSLLGTRCRCELLTVDGDAGASQSDR